MTLVAWFLAVWSATPSALASPNALPDPLELRFERLRGSDELRDPRILDIVQDRLGFLWLATVSGLVRYDGCEYRWFVSDPEDPHSLSDNRLRSLFVDHEGVLWAGTRGGVSRYDPRADQFTRYRHDPADPDSLSDDYVRAFYEDRDETLWVGTDNGLNRLDRETGSFGRYLYESGAAVEIGAGEALTIVQAVTEDRGGHLWVGSYGSGLFELVDGVPVKSYRRDPRNPKSLSDNRIMGLVTDASGTIWVSTWGGGVNAFDVETGSFRRYRYDPKDSSSLPGDQLLKLWLDRRDTVWVIATSGGLARLDRDSGRFIRYPHDPGRVGSPDDTLSGAAFEDAEGSLWLGTYGDGVEVWHPSKPRLVHYRAHDDPGGLSDDYVNVVREDRAGDLWAGTYHGLDHMDPAGRVLNSYRHDPASSNTHIPPVVITGIAIDNQLLPVNPDSALRQSIAATRELRLPSRTRSVSFEFAALDFQAPETNRYRYQLEGFAKGWAETDASHRLATYTDLDPGQYVFRVKGSNNTGLWNERGISLSLTVIPAWWQTMWFRPLAAASLLGFVFVLHRKNRNFDHGPGGALLKSGACGWGSGGRITHGKVRFACSGLSEEFIRTSRQTGIGETAVPSHQGDGMVGDRGGARPPLAF